MSGALHGLARRVPWRGRGYATKAGKLAPLLLIGSLLVDAAACHSKPDADAVLVLWQAQQSERSAEIGQLKKRVQAGRDEWGAASRSGGDAAVTVLSRVDAILKSSAQSLIDVETALRGADQTIRDTLTLDIVAAQQKVAANNDRVRQDLSVVRGELVDAEGQLAQLGMSRPNAAPAANAASR